MNFNQLIAGAIVNFNQLIAGVIVNFNQLIAGVFVNFIALKFNLSLISFNKNTDKLMQDNNVMYDSHYGSHQMFNVAKNLISFT